MPVTVLTNGMVFGRGNRRATLEALDRERVTLQISLDSATPDLHDRHRSAGSFAKARAGITLARSLGFRVRIAATVDATDAEGVAALRELLDTEGVPARDQVIRRIARQGFATSGVVLTRDDLYPEPTVAVDGVWWHPVGIADRAAHWNTVYDTKGDDVSWYQATPSVTLELLDTLRVSRDASVIDLGGGASVVVDHLLAREFTDVSVLDVSKVALPTELAEIFAPYFELVHTRAEEHLTPAGLVQPFTWVALRPST